MIAFNVKVRTDTITIQFSAIAKTSLDALNNAIDQFGIASVTVAAAFNEFDKATKVSFRLNKRGNHGQI
jgi:hypothetical protein